MLIKGEDKPTDSYEIEQWEKTAWASGPFYGTMNNELTWLIIKMQW